MINNQNNKIDNFPDIGYANLGSIIDKKECGKLRNLININRPINTNIFYKNKKDFTDNGRWHKYAPGAGHNFLEDMNLSFIEKNDKFVKAANKVLGKDYVILKRSVIRSVSKTYLPVWVQKYIQDVGRPNLNPFIKDIYQDVQYFYCTDYHQDKTRANSNFVTFYVYLDDVDRNYSALRILSGSHKAGMDVYPHNLRRSKIKKNIWYYTDKSGHTLKCPEVDITGKSGLVSCFHGLTLHGTPLNNSRDPRISIRYLLSPKDSRNAFSSSLFSKANKLVYGSQNIKIHRYDVKKDGSYLSIGSALDSYE
jgi:hypothetical protein